MTLVPYAKPYLNVAAQLALLQARQMNITDIAKATTALERIGYYRLSGYWYPMRRVTLPVGQGRPIVHDDFIPGSEFSDVIDLYVFDKRLRLMILDAIERIEIGLRVDVSLLIGARSPWAHRDPSQLGSKFTQGWPHKATSDHEKWLQKLDSLSFRADDAFIEHFKTSYSNRLPIWMAIEVWDFGLLSHFLSGMKENDQDHICAKYLIPRRDLFTSAIRSINHVRNICAHHGRLWNRTLSDQPKLVQIGQIPLLDHISGDATAQRRMYYATAFVQYLMRHINPTSTWKDRVKAHFQTFPTSTNLNVRHSGFPIGWDQLPLWT